MLGLVIRIPSKIISEMSMHALKTYPEEGCGLLIGVVNSGIKEVIKCIPMNNVYTGSRRNRYSIDPLEYMRIEDEAYKNGYMVLGIFHSHPDAPAIPSKYDQEYAAPLFIYVILSIRNGRVAEIAAWRVAESTWEFEQESLEIV